MASRIQLTVSDMERALPFHETLLRMLKIDLKPRRMLMWCVGALIEEYCGRMYTPPPGT